MFSLYERERGGEKKTHHGDNNKIDFKLNTTLLVTLELTEYRVKAAKYPGPGSAVYRTEIKSMGKSFHHGRELSLSQRGSV